MKPEYRKFRQRLLEEKGAIEESIGLMEKNSLGDRFTDSTGDLSAYDQHSGDSGSEMFERGKDIALQENEKIILGKINEALARIDNDTYGECEICGKDISRDRLEAIPYTTVCKSCKEEDEETVDRMRRPVEEDVLSPPFGKTFNDDTNHVEFDGEDSWQAVARWGTSNSPQDVPDAVRTDEAYIDSDERIGSVEDVESIIDVENEGIGDPEDIYPDPSTGKTRRPHPLDMKMPDEENVENEEEERD